MFRVHAGVVDYAILAIYFVVVLGIGWVGQAAGPHGAGLLLVWPLVAGHGVPILISEYLPNGMLGIAITGLLAAFMAGVAANVTAFNTVVSYDLWQSYVRKDEPDEYHVRFGRIATVLGIIVAIGTAFIAAGFNSIMDYIQALFSFFNAPLFATFIMAMFWKRATPWGASGGWPRAPWPRSPSTSSTPAAPWTWAPRWPPTSGGQARPLSSTWS
jgi:Na+/proline symporter